MALKTTCDNLETAFAEAEAKLDKVTEKVDETIAKVDTNSTNPGPSKLLNNLNEIKAEHQAISKEIEDLKNTQEVFVKDILKDLSKLEEAEAELVKKIGGEDVLN